MQILLVEDDPNDVRLTMHALEQGKVANRVELARNGVEALELLSRQTAGDGSPSQLPDVILLDLKLPLVDGIEVLQAVKADPRTRLIPVVVLTSSAEERDLQTCYELGVNSYIVKPVEVDAFFKAVRYLGFYWVALNRRPGSPV